MLLPLELGPVRNFILPCFRSRYVSFGTKVLTTSSCRGCLWRRHTDCHQPHFLSPPPPPPAPLDVNDIFLCYLRTNTAVLPGKHCQTDQTTEGEVGRMEGRRCVHGSPVQLCNQLYNSEEGGGMFQDHLLQSMHYGCLCVCKAPQKT